MGTKYDYSSIMHYSKTAFGNGRITIVTKDSSMQDVIGQRNGLSKIDVMQLNLMYRCKCCQLCTFPSVEIYLDPFLILYFI